MRNAVSPRWTAAEPCSEHCGQALYSPKRPQPTAVPREASSVLPYQQYQQYQQGLVLHLTDGTPREGDTSPRVGGNAGAAD
jgi:hypothetical protein